MWHLKMEGLDFQTLHNPNTRKPHTSVHLAVSVKLVWAGKKKKKNQVKLFLSSIK